MARVFRHGIVVLVAVLFSVQALAARQVIPEPGSVQRTWVPGSGPTAFVDSRDWNATVSTQSGARVEVPVTGKRSYGWPKWRAGAKSLIKGNAATALATAGIGALLAGVDWVMTEGILSKPNPMAGKTQCYTAFFSGGVSTQCDYGNANDACRALYTQVGTNISRGSGSLGGSGADAGGCYYYPQSGGYQVLGEWRRVVYSPDQLPPSHIPATDTDIDSLIDGVSDPSIAAQSAPGILDNVPGSFDYPDGFDFSGPASVDLPGVITTSTDPATGSTTTTEILPSVQFEYGTQPWSITPTDKTTKNTYEDGTKTNTEESVSTDPQNQPGVSIQPKTEVPTDCAFMPTVCKFIDWVKTPFNPEEPDLSQFIEDKDFAQDVNFSGNATCPPPTVIATSRGSFEFSWQPACDWAGLIKPLVILAALIGALYISVGAVRND
jgi:hypothetical protein